MATVLFHLMKHLLILSVDWIMVIWDHNYISFFDLIVVTK